jgi:glycosyltransferase involved in cell wall biosynthesis
VAPRVLHLSTYSEGGAGRAATSLHLAMRAQGIDSTLRTAKGSKFTIARQLERSTVRLQRSPWITWRSIGRFASISAKEINNTDADVVNLHWITDGFLSVEEIGRITKPLVWTMHDMWPFTGTEHYAVEQPLPTRWQQGYTTSNRPNDEHGFDLDRWAWERKRTNWSRHPLLIPVSTWLRDSASSSALASTWPATVIPNVMDPNKFQPGSQQHARKALGLPDSPLITFTSSAGISDERKGWDYLAQTLPLVKEQFPDVQVLVIGQSDTRAQALVGSDVIWAGHVSNDELMAQYLQASDVIAVPSTADNLPMTACEAQSAGRAVVAFRVGGLPDIIDHQSTGYLAEPFEIDDLANGLVACINNARSTNSWGTAAHEEAIERWSPERVVQRYLEAYERVLS